ncbi:hypothetical protein J4W33_17795, partial [Escherichia coli]
MIYRKNNVVFNTIPGISTIAINHSEVVVLWLSQRCRTKALHFWRCTRKYDEYCDAQDNTGKVANLLTTSTKKNNKKGGNCGDESTRTARHYNKKPRKSDQNIAEK